MAYSTRAVTPKKQQNWLFLKSQRHRFVSSPILRG